MSTAPLTRAGRWLPGRGSAVLSGRLRQGLSAPRLTAAGVLAVVLYAAFAHGGVSLASGTRIEVAVAAVAVVAGAAWLWTGTLRLAARRTAIWGVALLAGFIVWSALTLFWSVAPNQTWIEVNREVAYGLVLVLGIAVGASALGAGEFVARAFLAVTLVVTAYALGQKVFPGFRIPGVIDLNQTGPLPRLQEPLGYWNALALFLALGVPIALAMVTDATRSPRARLTTLCTLVLMLVTIALTYSRGGLLALVVALAVGMLLSGRPFHWAMWLAVAVLGALPGALVGLTSPQLTGVGVSLFAREVAGVVFLIVLVGSLAGLLAARRRLWALEARLELDPRRATVLRRRTAALGAGAVLLVIVVLGVTGVLSHAWHSFTTTRSTPNYNPQHLLSADSQNRWVWWKEAAGAFSDRPLGGWGAGSFSVVHLLYRRDTLSVQQPHSVPMQFLSETGIVGTLLAVAAFALLTLAAGRTVRRLEPGRQRLMAAALLAAVVAYAVHATYDWDWDIPAVTLPAMLFLGVLIGAGAPRWRALRERGSARGGSRPLSEQLPRLLALAILTLWLCTFAVSAELPEAAAARAAAALVQASGDSAPALASAQSAATAASRLDPLSDAGLLAEATIALHRSRPDRALVDLEQAIRRDPTDEQAWNQLTYVYLLLRDPAGVSMAAQRIIELDPRGSLAAAFERDQLAAAPPSGSSTAIPTPSLAP